MNFQSTNMSKYSALAIDFLISAGKFLGLILVAIITLKLTLYIVEKLLRKINPDKVIDKLNESEAFGKKKIEVDLIKICLPIVKWFVILIFVIVGSEILQLEMISSGISNLISVLPKLFTAVLIFVIGAYVASLVRNAVKSLMKSLASNASNIASATVFYIIVIFVSITALEQAGVNTTIITSNITLIFGCALATFTIAFGFGSKDVITRLLLGFYTKKTIMIGNKIEIDGLIGTVKSIDNIYLVVTHENEEVIYPIKEVSEKKIKILK